MRGPREFAEAITPRTLPRTRNVTINPCNLWIKTITQIMELPVNPPILPMLAKRVSELPKAGAWIFEPKWDGFRALIFRDGKEVFIQSRDEKPLNRYFPELIDPLLKQLPTRCVLDGEIVIAQKRRTRFRLAPVAASSRGVARQNALRTDSRVDRVLRSAE